MARSTRRRDRIFVNEYKNFKTLDPYGLKKRLSLNRRHPTQ